MSKGMGLSLFFGSFIIGSFITRALTLLRWALDLYTMNEKNTVSLGLAFVIRGNVVIFIPPMLGVRSSPTHSKYCMAPCFFQTFPPIAAIFLYSFSLFFGTVRTNPSTYVIISSSIVYFQYN